MNNCTKTPIAAAVTMRALADIRLDPKNPRSHNTNPGLVKGNLNTKQTLLCLKGCSVS